VPYERVLEKEKIVEVGDEAEPEVFCPPASSNTMHIALLFVLLFLLYLFAKKVCLQKHRKSNI